MELKIEYVPIDSIKPYEKNAKLEQIEQIKASIKEFGFKDPLAVWNGEVMAGNGRLQAAKELGLKELPIVRLDDLTDEQRRAYALVHNKLTMNSPFDDGILSEELENILDIDMSMFDFVENPQNFINDLMENEFAVPNTTNSGEFEITFQFNRENEQAIKNLIDEKGKQFFVDLITKMALGRG